MGRVEIAKKVGEEAIEVILAAEMQSDERLVEESADLLYYLLVLRADRGVLWAAVEAELARRRRWTGLPLPPVHSSAHQPEGPGRDSYQHDQVDGELDGDRSDQRLAQRRGRVGRWACPRRPTPHRA